MFRRLALSVAICAGTSAVVWASDPTPSTKPTRTKPDRSYGTAIQWEKDLETATKKAERERKLLLVLAVAGHFEDPFFT